MGVKVMPVTASGKPNACMVNIAGEVTIQHVKELHEQIGKMTCEKDTIILNLGDVESCDTAGLQLIWSFMKEAEKLEKKVEIHAVSPAVFEMAFETGIEMEKILNFKQEL